MTSSQEARRIHLYFGWDGYQTPARPSRLLDIKRSGEEEVGIPGIGTLGIIEDTSGDPHGGLWDGKFVAELSVVGSVALGVLANWIYDRISKASPPVVRINKREITVITRESITKVLEETIEFQPDDSDE